MSRYRSASAYNFKCRQVFSDLYEISWVVDFYYKGDRLRYPRAFRRETDEKGAKKFCKKHSLDFEKVQEKFSSRRK